ncbi:MAG: sugar phosphate nucleotidyltransferase [Gemmatimonadota bacterium]
MNDAPAVTKAVIMARGLGTRMRRANAGAPLSPEQDAIAAQGMKGMIPVGRPFMDYILSALADAGVRKVCLIIGPEHRMVREYYENVELKRLDRISFAVQQEPAGTANAVLAAESFAGPDNFLVLNSDNYYPIAACRELCRMDGPGLVAFSIRELVAGGIPEERVRAFPRIVRGENGCLSRLSIEDSANEGRVSMNIWRFSSHIFTACRAIQASPNGEWELPVAVAFAVDHLGECFRVIECDGAVLDVSSRADIAGVAQRLASTAVAL